MKTSVSEKEVISSAFPFESNYIDVLGSKMHYVEQGKGDPILFIHGVPTSSYLWRNIIPSVSSVGRCIAVDLIGFGKSDKPDIPYRVFDHIRYLDGFIQALKLERLTLVMHGWGSVPGFDYAMRHPEKIAGLAFLESHIRPITSHNMLALPVQQWASILEADDGSFNKIMNGNYFVDKVMPSGCLRQLTEEEMNYYRAPFSKPGSCLPIWQYFQDLPLGKGPDDVLKLIENYSNKLKQSNIPKLMLYGVPGFTTTMDTVMWAKQNLPNLTLVDLDEALYYTPEYKPNEISQHIVEWIKNNH